jgi:hypothetical protein
MTLRPVLKTFRVVSHRSENRAEGSREAWEFKMENTTEIGMAVPTVPGAPIQTLVKMHFRSHAQSSVNPQATASFEGEYQGNFSYPVEALVETEEHQYLLAAQVFPLAMTHFRRELQSTGFDARELPLGM